VQPELDARAVAGADVARDDGRRADVDRQRAGQGDPEQQRAEADGGEAIGADVVADERASTAEDRDGEALDDHAGPGKRGWCARCGCR
jgi:hypothetical protein